MKRAALIVNAAAGRRKNLQTLVPALVRVLEQNEVLVDATLTTAPGETQTIAADAAANGCDAVFACGGDGTVHEALQGLVGTASALGVVPLGTANALARNLGLCGTAVNCLANKLRRRALCRLPFAGIHSRRRRLAQQRSEARVARAGSPAS